ncbi:hypothetical protein ASPFODRAFT_440250 [Aspergillus luchuensis CBS 106.47]|uniref:Uncharacterized protein n=1 Tax=Aspergillus luchuensis (strain CBS 106.47) TaxID=1137211 RepID=A0A1M3TW66_ASPLC|nr:hypothetical protein ASPFODRAFT_440250 [Aspergillus luchuensis CBS 106.47]
MLNPDCYILSPLRETGFAELACTNTKQSKRHVIWMNYDLQVLCPVPRGALVSVTSNYRKGLFKQQTVCHVSWEQTPSIILPTAAIRQTRYLESTTHHVSWPFTQIQIRPIQ